MPNKTAFFCHQKSGCFWYRTKHPMDVLTGESINLETDIDMETYEQLKSVHIYGIYPFSFERVIRTLKEDGKKIVYDVDDAFDLIDPTNPFYYAVKKDVSSGNELFALADHVTVGTPALAEYVKNKTSAPITVIPNCYNPTEWTFPRPKREGIRIGFSGSTTHVAGLVEILPVIKHLQERFDVKFLIQGFGQTTYERWYHNFKYQAPAEGVATLEKLNELIKEIQFEWIPFVDFNIFPQVLTNMALDIGICPLKETPFNKCRGSSKAMEYTLSGALALASDTTPYRTDPTSVLVKEGEWLKTLTYYIENPQEREEKRLEHLDWIQKNRNIQDKAELLKSIYL